MHHFAGYDYCPDWYYRNTQHQRHNHRKIHQLRTLHTVVNISIPLNKIINPEVKLCTRPIRANSRFGIKKAAILRRLLTAILAKNSWLFPQCTELKNSGYVKQTKYLLLSTVQANIRTKIKQLIFFRNNSAPFLGARSVKQAIFCRFID